MNKIKGLLFDTSLFWGSLLQGNSGETGPCQGSRYSRQRAEDLKGWGFWDICSDKDDFDWLRKRSSDPAQALHLGDQVTEARTE